MKKWRGLLLSFVCGAVCSPLAWLLLSGPPPDPLPERVLKESASPSGAQTALVLQANRSDRCSVLPLFDERFYLALRRGDTLCVIARDLSDGFGGYEGGIGALTWEGDETIVVQRWVSDHEATVAFNTSDWTWSDRP